MSQLALWDDEPPADGAGPLPPPRFSPAQLARLLGIDEPTPEQSAVVSAPLAPMAVIAGAGSGKSETMAARLVWLVTSTAVRSGRLGRPDRSNPGEDWPGEADLTGDPVIATYHSYAGRLIADHALREALEPTMRLITPAVAWQLAAR